MKELTGVIVKEMSSPAVSELQSLVSALSPISVEREKNRIFRDSRPVCAFLENLTGAGESRIRGYFDELMNDDGFFSEINDACLLIANNNKISEFKFLASFLYVIVRALRPDIVIETGVASGKSSLYLLKGLYDNGSGHLYSIDLKPDPERRQADGYLIDLPEGKDIGWLVPLSLRNRWDLILGDSRVILPGLLKTMNNIDIFFHDSLHTYEHMSYEFDLAYEHLRAGGVLWADNVNDNDAYADFIKRHDLEPCFFRQTGGARKDR